MKNRLFKIVAVMMLSILVLSSASTASAGVSLSDSGLKIGAWLGQQATSGGINEWQQLSGRKLDTVMAYVDWGTSFSGISAIQPIYANGSIATITWEPWGMSNNDITRGSKDSYIRQMANDMRNFGKEIYISLMHEANGNWYPWAVGDSKENNNQTYIAAYRHVVDIFRNAGANNVKFIWCINAGSSGSGASFLGHYPGDNYVDYLAMDGYNWGPTQDWGSTWQSFDQIFSEPYRALSTINKPIIVTETSCTEIGGNKGQWITETFNTIKTKYTRVKLVSWFGENKEQDWRFNSSSGALQAFRAAVGTGSSQPTQTPTQQPTQRPTQQPTQQPTVQPTQQGGNTSNANVTVSSSQALSPVFNITAKGSALDLAKLKISYKFSKADSKNMNVWVDNAAAQLNVAPYYDSINGMVNAKVAKSGSDYVLEITFNKSYTIQPNAGTVSIQTRMANEDWSTATGIVAKGVTIG